MTASNDKTRVFLNSATVLAVVIENLIFFIINIIIARYLSVEHFGDYSTALGYATFFSTITNIGINQALIRAASINPENESQNLASAFYIKCVLGITIYIAMALSLYFTSYSHDLIKLTLIMGLFRIGNEFLSSFYSFFDAKESFILSSVFRIVFSASFLVITLSVVFFKGGLFDFAYLRLWLVLFFVTVLVFTNMKLISAGTSLATMINFSRESIPFGVLNILSNIYQRLNVIVLSILHGSQYTGFFSNGFIFFTTLFLIPVNISRVLLPYLYRISYDDDPEKFRFAFEIYSKFMTIISFYLLTLTVIFAAPLIHIIFGSRYNDSVIILQISAAGIPFYFSIAPTLIMALDRQKILTRIYIYGFFASIVSNFILINFFRSEGAAAAAVITYGYVYVSSNYYLVKKRIITSAGILKIFLSQSVIAALCFFVNVFLSPQTHPIISFAAVNAVFILMNLIFVINKNDIRIIKEIFKIS